MEKLLSNRGRLETLPENYVLPPEKRPDVHVNTCKQVPIVHLTVDNEEEVSNQIILEGKEFGFFQVVDHGIPEEVISDMMQVAQEFFGLSMEEKGLYYSEDATKHVRVFTSMQGRETEDISFWRDCLRLVWGGEGDEFRHLYPQNPTRFRDVFANYAVNVDRLAKRILKLISKGLGLDENYFNEDLSRGLTRINVNHYPPCPDPNLTLGLPSHCDPNLITLLHQGNVSGLQVLHCGEWLQVGPIKNVFIVNFGHVLEIVTNGLLKSVEHRAVTNRTDPRTTLATFVMPTEDCFIAPEPSLCSKEQHKPPIYKSFTYPEFFSMYVANQGDREKTIKGLMVEN